MRLDPNEIFKEHRVEQLANSQTANNKAFSYDNFNFSFYIGAFYIFSFLLSAVLFLLYIKYSRKYKNILNKIEEDFQSRKPQKMAKILMDLE